MQITGHKTESIYKRYGIASERGAINAGRQLRDHWRREEERAAAAKAQKNIDGELAANFRGWNEWSSMEPKTN